MTELIAARTADLLDSFGVVTHLPYTDGGYRELSATTDALQYLGIDHVRDQVPNPEYDSYGQEHFAEAAAQGIHFTFVTEGGVDPAVSVQRVHAIEEAYPGTVTAIEGPNEVNNWPVTYNGLTGTEGAQAYMQALYDAVQADPLLQDITVSGFTDWPNQASVSDTSTIHPYAKDGDQPLARIQQDMEDQNAVDPGKEFLITETGYHTQIDPSEGWEGVDEATQAKLLLNTYMDGALAGAHQTYVYELLDAYAGDSQEEHFGLFRLDNSPKPAADAIHNLTTILADSGSTAESFATGSLDLTVTGAPETGHTELTQKSDGSFQVITWAEPDIWNQDDNTPITVAPTTETISFGKSFQTVEIFDPLQGTAPVQTLHDVSSVDLDVTDHPLIVQLSGAGTDAAASPAPESPPATDTSAQGTTDATPAADTGDQATTDAAPATDTGDQATTDAAPATDTGDQATTDTTAATDTGDQATTDAAPATDTAGNDVITGGGHDTLQGGPGDDSYTVTWGDKVVELSGEGMDTIATALRHFALPDNVENLVLTGNHWARASGNDLANAITGNDAPNLLNGGGGDDVLTGGGGHDAFVIGKDQGHDVILDFEGAGEGGGDKLLFRGFGHDATLTHEGDDWAIHAADGSVTQVTIEHVTSLAPSDYVFG